MIKTDSYSSSHRGCQDDSCSLHPERIPDVWLHRSSGYLAARSGRKKAFIQGEWRVFARVLLLVWRRLDGAGWDRYSRHGNQRARKYACNVDADQCLVRFHAWGETRYEPTQSCFALDVGTCNGGNSVKLFCNYIAHIFTLWMIYLNSAMLYVAYQRSHLLEYHCRWQYGTEKLHGWVLLR